MPEVTCTWSSCATHISNYQGIQYMKHLQKQSYINLTSSWLSVNLVIKSTPHVFDLHNSYIIPSTDFFNSLLSLSLKENMEAKFVSAGCAEIFAKTHKYFITSAVQMYLTVRLKQLQFVLIRVNLHYKWHPLFRNNTSFIYLCSKAHNRET